MALANPFDFTGRTVVPAGAIGGLGRPVAAACAEAGANLATRARGAPALSRFADDLKGARGGLGAKPADLCDQSEVAGFVDGVPARLGAIDVLMSLVGGIIRKPSVDYSRADFREVVGLVNPGQLDPDIGELIPIHINEVLKNLRNGRYLTRSVLMLPFGS